MGFRRVINIMGELKDVEHIPTSVDHSVFLRTALEEERRRLIMEGVTDIHKRMTVGDKDYRISVVIKLDGKYYVKQNVHGVDIKRFIIDRSIFDVTMDEPRELHCDTNIFNLDCMDDIMDARCASYKSILGEFHHQVKKILGYPA